MNENRPTRRKYLGGLGAALAGCTGTLGGASGNDTAGSAQSRNATTASDPTTTTGNTTGGTESPYTRVYRETVPSVVLLEATTPNGGGQGTGFVHRDNYIVTNAHVVSDATNVRARFSKGEWRTASVVGADPSADLAVVEVENPPEYATPLSLVDSQPPIGTEVVAIGNPYGLEGSVTSGLISGVNRSIPAPNGYTIPDAIQTGAPVNPGNSGGPLVTLDGKVVGVINSGGGDNLAFAISAALVKRVVPALIEDGEYKHASLGVSLETVTPRIAERIGLDRSRGVLVREVRAGGPSANALERGDVIIGIGGTEIDTRQQLSSYLALQASPGETVTLTLLRDGEQRTVEVTLGARPERPDAGIGTGDAPPKR